MSGNDGDLPREFWIDDLTLRRCGPWSEAKDITWPDSEKIIHVREVKEESAFRDWGKPFEEEYLKDHDWLHACLTGDCPHATNQECFRACWDSALNIIARPLHRSRGSWKAKADRLEKENRDFRNALAEVAGIWMRRHGTYAACLKADPNNEFKIISEALAAEQEKPK
jgi:hypothetical protein